MYVPYRAAEYRPFCHVCGAPTRSHCCKCTAPVCSDHGCELAVQFFVPTVACADERRCHSRAPQRRSYEPADEVTTPWGISVKRYLG